MRGSPLAPVHPATAGDDDGVRADAGLPRGGEETAGRHVRRRRAGRRRRVAGRAAEHSGRVLLLLTPGPALRRT
jgi:hypothetical protein